MEVAILSHSRSNGRQPGPRPPPAFALVVPVSHDCMHGGDMPEIRDWRWGHQDEGGGLRAAETEGDNV
jgi:hypothetical protein